MRPAPAAISAQFDVSLNPGFAPATKTQSDGSLKSVAPRFTGPACPT